MPAQPRGARHSSRDRVEAVFSKLEERRIDREQDLSNFSNAPIHRVDNDESDTPIWTHFERLLNVLWLTVRDHVRMNYNVGRGKRSQIKPKDAFFMTLVMLKEGGTFDSNARIGDDYLHGRCH
ncbi:hypothetical protein GN958_ATG13178 [Phytophthora infestans]|uniref:Uncharacterized protein n=1 Tax=Phytophthora infestans TaxID=4787 RepID=A0A8S9UA18_PHYIN|nr:hypothetical protein GN958_ATG13178 [Phytophthora infestans]